MFVAASTHCFSDVSFQLACAQLADLEYDKVEIWMNEESEHLKPTFVAEDPERFAASFRECTRLTPIAFCLNNDPGNETLLGLAKAAKLLNVTQITIPASPLGTPFNTEVDRLREYVKIVNQDGIHLSIKTKIGDISEDPHTAVELCESVKGLGITLDPSHFMCGPHRTISYDQVFPYVYHVHFRDSTPEMMQTKVGLGEVDYSRVIDMLEQQKYKQAFSVEILPTQEIEQDRPLEMRKIRMLLESLL